MIRKLQTLRARRAVLLLIVFGVILSGLSASVLKLRERYLREDFDDRLNDRAEAVIDTVSATTGDAAMSEWSEPLRNRLSRYRFPGYFIQVPIAGSHRCRPVAAA